MRTRPWSFLALVLAATGLSACALLPTGDCTTELEVRLEPAARVLRVGESFAPDAEFRGCQGRKSWRPVLTWRTADTLVVTVDAARGLVTGRAPGVARVYPVERRAGGQERPFYGDAVAVSVQ